jgi:hypothetical protein
VRAAGRGLPRAVVTPVPSSSPPHALPRRAGERLKRAVAALAAVVLACAPAALAGRPGAPIPLSAGYPELRARFDADAGRPRLLVVASPT